MLTALLDVSVLRTHTRRTGIGRYVLDLCRALPGAASDVRVQGLSRLPFMAGPQVEHDLAAWAAELGAVSSMSAYWSWTYRVRLAMARTVRQVHADVLHSGHPNATPLGTLGCPRIVTCHDLIPLAYPKHYLSLADGYAAGRLRLDKRRYGSADHVIAVSQATALELTRLLDIDPAKISVVHNGVDLARWSPSDPGSDAELREPYGLKLPYLVYAGAGDYRKNADGMFRGLKRALRQLGGGALELVWAGSLTATARTGLEALARRHGVLDSVRWLGYVPDASLAALYRGALALLFVSRAEGFGYPVVEAMACGCPVVTSNGSSLHEIAEGAAITCHPDDEQAIGRGIVTLLGDAGQRATLRQLGMARARLFSLDRMAVGTLDVYRRVATGGSKGPAELS